MSLINIVMTVNAEGECIAAGVSCDVSASSIASVRRCGRCPPTSKRARQYDLRKDDGRIFSVRSALPIEKQQRALGATWLDRELLRSSPSAPMGFGVQVREALKHRADFLIGQGLAQRRGRQLVFARDLLKTLQAKELAQVGEALGREFNRQFRLPAEGERIGGIYQRSFMLSSGRFALLDDGASFSLIPWRPVMESRLGRSLSGVASQGHVSWDFGRTPSLGR